MTEGDIGKFTIDLASRLHDGLDDTQLKNVPVLYVTGIGITVDGVHPMSTTGFLEHGES
jgi:hypothetical protein